MPNTLYVTFLLFRVLPFRVLPFRVLLFRVLLFPAEYDGNCELYGDAIGDTLGERIPS